MDVDAHDEPRSFRSRLNQPPDDHSADAAGNPETPVSRLIWRELVEEEIDPLREEVARLAAARAEDHDAIRTASSGWSEQIGFLRGQAQGFDERVRSDRKELHAAIERLQDEVTRLGGYAFQTQVQERMINRVEGDHARLAESLSEVSQELALVIERFDNRLSTVQAELGRQRSRISEMTAAVLIGATGVIIGLAIAIAPRFF